MALFKLSVRNLLKHPLRSLLTTGSLVVALFLLCTLRSLVSTLEAGGDAARNDRLWVQSAVSLFVELPLSYPEKIVRVDGVEQACKWQWFGGYYQDPGNFFAQFAVDQEEMLEMYPEVEIVEGHRELFLSQRNTCMIGRGLAESFGWEVGDTIPIIGAQFPHPDGADVAWEFEVAAVYEPTSRTFDRRTLFFHWDLFEETLKETQLGTQGVGAIVIRTAAGADQTQVMRSIDELFENGPQRVQTTTESEFNAQFVSMFGNVPFFVGAIGGAVLLAILMACLNTMLMAGREQIRDVGILKALGFADRGIFGLMLVQAIVLCGLGGGLGIALAKSLEGTLARLLGGFVPGYRIEPETVLLAAGTTLAIGLVAGIVPAWNASRLRVVEALGMRE